MKKSISIIKHFPKTKSLDKRQLSKVKGGGGEYVIIIDIIGG